MKLRRSWTACLVAAWNFQFGRAASPESQETANRLAASIYTGPSMTTLRELAMDLEAA